MKRFTKFASLALILSNLAAPAKVFAEPINSVNSVESSIELTH